jgi:hypothetical protein
MSSLKKKATVVLLSTDKVSIIHKQNNINNEK